MIKLYDFIERKLLIGNSKPQWLFESLHRFSLRAMNYNQVQSIYESGVFVIKHLAKKISK